MAKNLSVNRNEDNPEFGEICNMSSNPRKKKRTLTSLKEKPEVAHKERKDYEGTSKEEVIECENKVSLEEEEFEKRHDLEVLTIDMDKNLPKKKNRPVPIKRKISKEIIEKKYTAAQSSLTVSKEKETAGCEKDEKYKSVKGKRRILPTKRKFSEKVIELPSDSCQPQ